jgi:prophage regulatory protein
MRIIKREEVSHKTGLERSAIYQRVKLGTFPRQVQMGPKSVGWIEEEVEQWIAERVAVRDARKNGEDI